METNKYLPDNNYTSEIFDIIMALSRDVKHDDFLDMLLSRMMELTCSDAGTLYVMEDEALHFCIVKTKSLGIDKTMRDVHDWPPIKLDKENINNVSVLCAIKSEVIVVDDVYADILYNFEGTKNYDKMSGYHTKSMILLPLVAFSKGRAKMLGVIQLMNAMKDGEIISFKNFNNIELLTAFSCIAATTLLNILNEQEIETLHGFTLIDVLTGLGNRRFMNDVLTETFTRSLLIKEPVSLLIMDIDHFKNVNDTYGHLFGDEVLKAVSQILRKAIRGADHIARWGGEEFAIILPNTTLLGALCVAENVRVAVESFEFDVGEEKPFKITISIGVQSTDNVNTTGYFQENFVKDADDALYYSKQNGRNKVSAAPA